MVTLCLPRRLTSTTAGPSTTPGGSVNTALPHPLYLTGASSQAGGVGLPGACSGTIDLLLQRTGNTPSELTLAPPARFKEVARGTSPERPSLGAVAPEGSALCAER